MFKRIRGIFWGKAASRPSASETQKKILTDWGQAAYRLLATEKMTVMGFMRATDATLSRLTGNPDDGKNTILFAISLAQTHRVNYLKMHKAGVRLVPDMLNRVAQELLSRCEKIGVTLRPLPQGARYSARLCEKIRSLDS